MSSATPIPIEKSTARGSHRRLHFVMLLVTVCWASNIIAGKEALTGFDSLALAQLRVLGTAVIYAICFLATGRIARLRLSPRKWLLVVAGSLSGVTLNQLFFIGGLARSTVAHTGLIVALGPVMVLVIAVLIRLEALTTWKFVGMMISFVGVGILTVDNATRGNGEHWMGDLILLAGTAVFAVYTILVKELANQYDTLTLNTLIFVPGAILMVPFCARAVAATNLAGLRLEAWWGLAFMILFGSVVPYVLFAYALTELAASRVAAFNYLQPVIASSLGIWVLSEKLTTKVLIGGALILAGVYLTERERGEEGPA
ncbi:MAG: DMT family transporter [Acidobacteriia bacterium]|nr:DMT family transporter [Terriglobia bacterium]